MENDFLKHLSAYQVQDIVDYMKRNTVVAGTIVIQEGEAGGYLGYITSVVCFRPSVGINTECGLKFGTLSRSKLGRLKISLLLRCFGIFPLLHP